MALYEISFKGLGNKTVRRLRDGKAEAHKLKDYLERHGITCKVRTLKT